MATHKVSTGSVKVAVSGGTEAVVGEVRSYSIDETADTIEDTVMGDSVKSYLSSLKDATLTIAAIDWEIHPTGTGSGEKYYAGAGVVTAKTISASYDGLVEASFSVQVSGAITEAAN